MRQAVDLGVEVGKRRAAGAGAGRIAALGHEAFDHPVEDEAVVEALAGQGPDPLDMAGRGVGAKLDRDPAAGRQIEIPDILRLGRRHRLQRDRRGLPDGGAGDEHAGKASQKRQ